MKEILDRPALVYDHTRFPPCTYPLCSAPASYTDGKRAYCNVHDVGLVETRDARRLHPHWDPKRYAAAWADKHASTSTAEASSSPPSFHVHAPPYDENEIQEQLAARVPPKDYFAELFLAALLALILLGVFTILVLAGDYQ